MTDKSINGFLKVDKPAGWTSFDVVAKVRSEIEKAILENPELCACSQCKKEMKRASSRINDTAMSTEASDAAMAQESSRSGRALPSSRRRRHKVRVGHSGTLDPFATGLLILAVGKATKQISEITNLDKTYETTIKLGYTTDTLDPESEEVLVSQRKPTHSEIEKVLTEFIGEQQQVPPKFSAIKVNGRRAYNLARAGKSVDLEPRNVVIHSIKLREFNYPDVRLRTNVSKGTYIRSMARDIGEKLGTGGYLSSLRRVSIGRFKVKGALDPNDLDGNTIKDALFTLESIAN